MKKLDVILTALLCRIDEAILKDNYELADTLSKIYQRLACTRGSND